VVGAGDASGTSRRLMIELLPWSNVDLWAVDRFLSDPEMMNTLALDLSLKLDHPHSN
jgi:hypothetical protein